MPTFEVEIIHEPSGAYMNFETEIDDVTEENAWQFIMDDLSIIVNQIEE